MLDAFITQYSLNILLIPFLISAGTLDFVLWWIRWPLYLFTTVAYSFLLIERNSEVSGYRVVSIVSIGCLLVLDGLIIGHIPYDEYAGSLYIHVFRLVEKTCWDALLFLVVCLDYRYFGSGLLEFSHYKSTCLYLNQ